MSDTPLSPEEVASRRFTTTFRGLDPEEVQSYLTRIAEELRSLRRREEEWRRQLADAEHRAAHPEWDETAVSNAIGEQTSRILSSAQTVAQELKARAEENAARILRDAHAEAQRIREQAESVLVERTDEAEAEAAKIRLAAQAEADSLVEHSRRRAESTVAEAEAYATNLVEEAKANQQRILSEFARRRRIAHIQVEQLRAGRERLLEAYRVVRSTLDEVVAELQRAEPEARMAADAAVRRLGPDAGLVERPPPAMEERGRPVEGELDVVRPASEVQAVRVITPEPPPETEPQAEAEVEPEAEPAAHLGPEPVPEAEPEPEAEPDAEPEPVAAGTEPTADFQPEPVEEPGPVASVRPESQPVVNAEPGTAPVVNAEPGTEPVAATAEELSDPGAPGSPVEELFARIRADRATAVARAREVLSEEASGSGTRDGSPASSTAPFVASVSGDELGEAPLSEAEKGELERRDGLLGPVTAGLGRRLKRVLQDEQNELLDRLRSEGPSGAKGSSRVLPPGDDQTVRYAGAGEEALRQAAEEGARFYSGQDAATPDVTDLALGLAEALTGPLRRQLQEAVAGADHEDHAALVQRISAAYRECKAQRVDELAADSVIAAFSRGIVAASSHAQLRWVVQDEAGPCPDCDDNALAGATACGEPYPTGQQHPPAHGGCRCLLLPAP